MAKHLPRTLPTAHREFLDHVVGKLSEEPWLIAIAASGSYTTDTMDAFSDLDLVLAVEEEAHSAVMPNRIAVAESLGTLLSAFSGEHVGLPRLLICLYGPPLLHVDFIWDTLLEIVKRSDNLVVLWEHDERLSSHLTSRPITNPPLDYQWMEDRFWVWIHKACGKIGRGELLEAVEYLTFLRSKVLGPLGQAVAGKIPMGVRRLELDAPALARDLAATLALSNAHDCLRALRACVDLYRRLRPDEGATFAHRHGAEQAVTDYLAGLENRVGAVSTTA